MSENKFLKGAAILGIAGAIVKVLGAFYRIPLGNILGTEGMGYYQTAYPLYILLLTLSTAGFPVAVAKLVSEKRAIGDYKGAFKVFKVAFFGLFIGGLLTSVFVYFLGEKIVLRLGNQNAYYALMGLVPALFFTPIMGSMRGFFQGNQRMGPTALSQIGEQLFRVILGLVFTYQALDLGKAKAAGGASLGGSAGAIAGSLIIFIIYLRERESFKEEMKLSLGEESSVRDIAKELLAIAIPITLGSAVVPIMNTIDTALVLKRLQSIGYSEKMANDLYGQLTGFAQTLVNLPQVFSMALAVSLVPAISQAKAKKDIDEIKNMSKSGIRITLLIGLPCAFGLFILSEPIINLLYFKNPPEVIASIGELLAILSFSVIFLTLIQSLTAILQGMGRPMIPVVNIFIGAIFKIVLTYVLTGIESINIKGAAISTLVAYFIAAVLDIRAVKKYGKMKLDGRHLVFKPLLSSIGMTIVVRLSYLLSLNFLGSKLSTLVAIALGGLSYLLLLFLTGSITYGDIVLLPKGEKIGKKLIEKNILKEE